MSSVPQSPRFPGTPVKSVAENERSLSGTPTGRRLSGNPTPRANGTGKGKDKEKEMGLDLPVPEIQVPSTIPPKDMEEDHVEEARDKEMHSDQTEIADDPQADLPPFDWESFQARYKEALGNASDQEDEILLEFERLSTVSSLPLFCL